MKKFNWVLGWSLFFLFVLSACGSKEQTATYTLKQGDENVTIQNVYKEDLLLKQTVKTVIQYKTMGVDKKKAEKLLVPLKEMYANKEGLSYSMDFKENKAIETIEVELKKLSKKEAKTLPLISLPDDSFDSASEKANSEKLKKLGFTKKD